MDQCRCLKRVVWLFLTEPRPGHPTQFFVDERQ